MAINRKVVSLILLAALDYKAGDRAKASKSLLRASEDPDFDETLEGLSEVTDEETDPFLNPEQADGDEDDGAGAGEDDGENDDDTQLNGLEDLLSQSASLARVAKRKPATAAEDDKIGGNDGPQGADADNNSDEEIRQEAQVARLKQVRANLIALANVR